MYREYFINRRCIGKTLGERIMSIAKVNLKEDRTMETILESIANLMTLNDFKRASEELLNLNTVAIKSVKGHEIGQIGDCCSRINDFIMNCWKACDNAVSFGIKVDKDSLVAVSKGKYLGILSF